MQPKPTATQIRCPIITDKNVLIILIQIPTKELKKADLGFKNLHIKLDRFTINTKSLILFNS